MSALTQTSYLGLDLKCPIVAASSPFTGAVASARRLEEAGVGAIVMRSAFEEEIRSEIASIYDDLGDIGSAVALDYLRADLPMRLGPQRYVELLRAIRREVVVPVIASVNCTTSEQWTSFAKRLEVAGADALELNVYDIPVDPAETAEDVIRRHIGIVEAVASTVHIPVALKIGPFYSSLMNFCIRAEKAGAKGLVLFNRFLQPDIDVAAPAIREEINLSHEDDIRLPLRWTALLRGRLKCSIGLSGGVLSGEGVVKAILAGADVAYVCSALYKGFGVVGEMLSYVDKWATDHGHRRVDDFRGLLREKDFTDGHGFERAHYMNILAGAAAKAAPSEEDGRKSAEKSDRNAWELA